MATQKTTVTARVKIAWWYAPWQALCIGMARCGFLVSDAHVERMIKRATKITVN